MAEDDRAYYQRRAEVEVALAEQSKVPIAGRAHFELAKAYLDRLAMTDVPQATAS